MEARLHDGDRGAPLQLASAARAGGRTDGRRGTASYRDIKLHESAVNYWGSSGPGPSLACPDPQEQSKVETGGAQEGCQAAPTHGTARGHSRPRGSAVSVRLCYEEGNVDLRKMLQLMLLLLLLLLLLL